MQVTFKDVAGVDEAKLELEEVVDFFRQPAKYQKLGGRIPKGVLLVVPPGFNGRLRDECLNVEWFTSLEGARRGLALWRDHYNHRRPHSALDDRSPAVFAGLQGEALSRIARTRDSLLRIWSNFQARQTGSGGP